MQDFLTTQIRILNDGTFNLDPTTGGVHVPAWAFKPDQWSIAFLRGLTKLASGWKNLRVWEVGVGTGVNLMVLRIQSPSTQWYFSDYDARCVPLAMRNLLRSGAGRRGLHPLYSVWDLVTPPPDRGQSVPRAQVIFGCLPQVPSVLDLSVGDRRAHYYDTTLYREAHQNAVGLGLNETLLVRARTVLVPGGSVVLNLSGRPGLERLLPLFRKAGYQPTVIHSETIPQHADTSLASLAALEECGQSDFEFFADADCKMSVNAGEAETRRVSGQKVFHKIYVIAGTLA